MQQVCFGLIKKNGLPRLFIPKLKYTPRVTVFNYTDAIQNAQKSKNCMPAYHSHNLLNFFSILNWNIIKPFRKTHQILGRSTPRWTD